jgi:hypothetical protein
VRRQAGGPGVRGPCPAAGGLYLRPGRHPARSGGRPGLGRQRWAHRCSPARRTRAAGGPARRLSARRQARAFRRPRRPPPQPTRGPPPRPPPHPPVSEAHHQIDFAISQALVRGPGAGGTHSAQAAAARTWPPLPARAQAARPTGCLISPFTTSLYPIPTPPPPPLPQIKNKPAYIEICCNLPTLKHMSFLVGATGGGLGLGAGGGLCVLGGWGGGCSTREAVAAPGWAPIKRRRAVPARAAAAAGGPGPVERANVALRPARPPGKPPPFSPRHFGTLQRQKRRPRAHAPGR